MEHILFIDKRTGTWGMASDIVFVNADMEGQVSDPIGGDDATVISYLDNASDSEIIDFANDAHKRFREGQFSGFINDGEGFVQLADFFGNTNHYDNED